MGFVRMAAPSRTDGLYRMPCRRTRCALRPNRELLVLDVVFIVVTLAVFAIIGLIARGVERLDTGPRGSARREARGAQERG